MSSEERRKELERRSSFLSEKVELVKSCISSSIREAFNPSTLGKNLPIHMRANAGVDGVKFESDD